MVKAGSLMEEEDQRGLAHFCEHLAFSATDDALLVLGTKLSQHRHSVASSFMTPSDRARFSPVSHFPREKDRSTPILQ